MAKTINPKVTITEWKTIQTIWTGIPDFKMGTIGADEFNAAYDETVALNEIYDAKDLELTGIRERRDDKVRQLNGLVTRFRSGMRSMYGPDSPEYEQAGGTRTSNRKPPRRKQPADSTMVGSMTTIPATAVRTTASTTA